MFGSRGRSEDDVTSLGTRDTDGHAPPCVSWELNPCPLQQQPVFLASEETLVVMYNFNVIIFSFPMGEYLRVKSWVIQEALG